MKYGVSRKVFPCVYFVSSITLSILYTEYTVSLAKMKYRNDLSNTGHYHHSVECIFGNNKKYTQFILYAMNILLTAEQQSGLINRFCVVVLRLISHNKNHPHNYK